MIEAKPTAITTRDGKRHVFRSRVEARWARYFEAMGMPFVYEPFKFVLNERGLTYTPDFEVEGIGIVEIKPAFELLSESIERIEQYVEKTGNRVYCFCGAQPFGAAVIILARSPLQILHLDAMQATLVLCGTQRHEAAKRDYSIVDHAVRQAIWEASRPDFEHDAMSVGELMAFSDARHLDSGEAARGKRALQRMMRQQAKESAA